MKPVGPFLASEPLPMLFPSILLSLHVTNFHSCFCSQPRCHFHLDTILDLCLILFFYHIAFCPSLVQYVDFVIIVVNFLFFLSKLEPSQGQKLYVHCFLLYLYHLVQYLVQKRERHLIAIKYSSLYPSTHLDSMPCTKGMLNTNLMNPVTLTHCSDCVTENAGLLRNRVTQLVGLGAIIRLSAQKWTQLC